MSIFSSVGCPWQGKILGRDSVSRLRSLSTDFSLVLRGDGGRGGGGGAVFGLISLFKIVYFHSASLHLHVGV